MTSPVPEAPPLPPEPVAPAAPEGPEVKPLAAASRRMRLAKRRRRLADRPGIQDQVAAMAAAGISQSRIAAALEINQPAVQRIASSPAVQDAIAGFRAHLRHNTVERLSGMHEDLMDWLAGTVHARDARSFDSVSRGVFSLEKTAASASGEARRVEQTVTQESSSSEGRQLLAILLGQK